jgi:hypothetical protein
VRTFSASGCSGSGKLAGSIAAGGEFVDDVAGGIAGEILDEEDRLELAEPHLVHPSRRRFDVERPLGGHEIEGAAFFASAVAVADDDQIARHAGPPAPLSIKGDGHRKRRFVARFTLVSWTHDAFSSSRSPA